MKQVAPLRYDVIFKKAFSVPEIMQHVRYPDHYHIFLHYHCAALFRCAPLLRI